MQTSMFFGRVPVLNREIIRKIKLCSWFVCNRQHRHNLSLMPPKRKESAATPAASGPKQKRSRTSFRTPTTAALEPSTSEVGSTSTSSKNLNRVVTLRASASGRRGYRSQDLSTTQSSALDSAVPENLANPPVIIGDLADLDTSDLNPPPDLEGDTQPGSSSGTNSRPKQKNTTTVGYIG